MEPIQVALVSLMSIRNRRVGPADHVGLQKDAVAVCLTHRTRIIEAAHSLQRAEGVIEGAIFLHHDNNVLRIQIRRPGRWCDGKGSLYRLRPQLPDTPARPPRIAALFRKLRLVGDILLLLVKAMCQRPHAMNLQQTARMEIPLSLYTVTALEQQASLDLTNRPGP